MKKYLIFPLFFVFTRFLLFGQSNTELLDEGMKHFRQGNYILAREIFDKIITNGEVEKQILGTAEFYSAECLLEEELFDAAATELERYVEEYPFSVYREAALFALGESYFELNLYARSRNRLLTMIGEYPESEYSGRAYFLIAEGYSNENQYAEAAEYYMKAQSAGDNSFLQNSYFSIACNYELQGDYRLAIDYYDTLVTFHREHPITPEAQFRLGICYFKLKEYDSAVLELSDPMINKLDGERRIEAEYLLAASFFRLREYQNASDIFNKLIENSKGGSNQRQIKFSLGWLNFQSGKYDEAFGLFKELYSTGTDITSANALYWGAESKRYGGNTEEALELYQSFLNKYPGNSLAGDARFNIGVIYFNEGNIGESEEYLMTTLEGDDKISRSKSLKLLGEMSLNRRDLDSARKYYLEARETEGLPEDLLNGIDLGLGVTEYYLGNYERSAALLKGLNSRSNRFEKNKVNLYLAEALFEIENYSEALKHFSRVDDSDPALSKETLYGRAYSFFNLKDYANAIFYFGEFTRLYKRDSKYADSRLRLAESYYGVKDFKNASDVFTEVFNSYGSAITDASNYFYGQSLFKAGREEKAKEELLLLQRRFPRSKYADDSQYLIGWIFFQQGEFLPAIESYKVIFERYPSSAVVPIALYSIGDAFYNLAEYDSAIAYYQKLIEDHPGSRYVFDAVNGIQFCYQAMGRDDKAVDFIENYVGNYPDGAYSDQVYYKKGDIYFSRGEYDKSITGYTDFIRKYPASPLVTDANFWIAKSYLMQNKTEEAEPFLQGEIERDVNSEVGISSLLELGRLYNRKGMFREEISIYDDALKKISKPDKEPEILLAKGKAQTAVGDTVDAYGTFTYINQYYSASVFTAKARLEMGLLLLARKDYSNAEMLFRELGEGRLDDVGAQAQYYYGLALFEQEKITDAVTAFVRVRSVFSGYDEWYTRSLIKLGDCYVEMRDNKQAAEMYKAVLKKHGSDEFGKEAKRKLDRI